MEIKPLKKCFCVDLKTGTLIIGIFSIITSIVMLIKESVTFRGDCAAEKEAENTEKCSKTVIFLAGGVTFEILELIGTISVIYGSQKEKRSYMLPPLFIDAILIVILTISLWFCIIFTIFKVSMGTEMMTLIIGNLFIVLFVYTWLVTYSRAEEIKNNKSRPIGVIRLPAEEFSVITPPSGDLKY